MKSESFRSIRLGLCCQFAREPIKFRTMTASALLKLPRAERLGRVSELCLANAGALMASLLDEAGRRWDMPALHAQVLASQRRRRFVYGALTQGRLTSWDHQPLVDASQQYMRNHIDLDDLERRARFPRP
jgi:hypothetical protein